MMNLRNKNIVVQKMERASTLWPRLKGLLGRDSLAKGEGLLIERCGNSIHTFFMKFPIDVVFLNTQGLVRYVARDVKPWRIVVAPILGRTDCLELPAGTVKSADVKVGDTLRVEA